MTYNTEWVDYYVYLERLRQSGATNMFGAGSYLSATFGLGRREASDILDSWMKNYDALVHEGIIDEGE